MPDLSFNTVLVVAAIALVAPLVVMAAPKLRMPAVVLEIVLGIVVGPSGFDWVRVDVPVRVLALFGLGFLLFLAGLEIDPRRLRGGITRIGLAFGVSFVLALVAGFLTDAIGETSAPLFVAIALVSTSLGLVVPVLSDAGQTDTEFGQLALAACSVAEFGSIVLVSLFFSKNSSSTASTLFLISTFAALVAVIGLVLSRAGQSLRVSATLLRLEETTAQLGVRIAICCSLCSSCSRLSWGWRRSWERSLPARCCGSSIPISTWFTSVSEPKSRQSAMASLSRCSSCRAV